MSVDLNVIKNYINQQLRNLDNIDYSKKKERINSPRSLEALNLLGIEPQKLYYKTFKEFLEEHPDYKVLDHHLQEHRYKHHEDKRVNRIKMATEKRSDLLNNLNGKSSYSGDEKSAKGSTLLSINPTSTAVKDDRKRLERLKSKQIWELQTIIDNEFQLEETRKNNEQKLKEIKEKEEKIKQTKLEKLKEHSKRRELKEREREIKVQADLEAQLKLQKERDEEEARQRVEDMRRKEKEEKENQQRIMKQQKEEEEFRKQIGSMHEYQQNQLAIKKKELKEKDEQRSKFLEEMKKNKKLAVKEQAEKIKIKIERTLSNNDEKLENLRKRFEQRQKEIEENKQKYEIKKNEKKKIQEELAKKKEEEILKVLRVNEEKELEKIENINKKHGEQNTQKILKKIHEHYETLLFNFENRKIEREDKYENVLRYNKIQDYERNKKLQELLQKMKKIDEMKKQKIKIAEEQRKMQDEIQIKKKEMMTTFEKLMKKGKNLKKEEFYNKIFSETNQKTFSGNTSLDNKEKTSSDIFSENEKTLPQYYQSVNEKQEQLNAYDVIQVEDEAQSNNETKEYPKHRQKNSEKIEIDQVKSKTGSHQSPHHKKSVKYLSSEDIQEKTSEKKKELEHALYDAITKFELTERQILEDLKENENDDERAELVVKYDAMKIDNENEIEQKKMRIQNELEIYEKNLMEENMIGN